MMGKMSIGLIASLPSNKGHTLLEKNEAATKSESRSSLWSRATRTRGRRIALATAAAFTAVGLAVGGAAAVSTTQSAGSVTAQQYATNSDATYVSATGTNGGAVTWGNVPGAAVSLTIPSGTSRVIDARYTAESQCLGSGWCSARIVYQKVGGSLTEMRPASGADFAFDSAGGDVSGSWESHAIERSSVRLGAGTYRVWVQASRINSASEFRLDEQHLAVSLNS